MAPLDTGRYIITNCRYYNAAVLLDSNDRSGVVACNPDNDTREIWTVKLLTNGSYTIQNFAFSLYATGEKGYWTKQGDSVVGGSGSSEWSINEMRSKGHYCICLTRDPDVCWSLQDVVSHTPVNLDRPPNTTQNQWKFTRVEDGRLAKLPASVPIQVSHLDFSPLVANQMSTEGQTAKKKRQAKGKTQTKDNINRRVLEEDKIWTGRSGGNAQEMPLAEDADEPRQNDIKIERSEDLASVSEDGRQPEVQAKRQGGLETQRGVDTYRRNRGQRQRAQRHRRGVILGNERASERGPTPHFTVGTSDEFAHVQTPQSIDASADSQAASFQARCSPTRSAIAQAKPTSISSAIPQTQPFPSPINTQAQFPVTTMTVGMSPNMALSPEVLPIEDALSQLVSMCKSDIGLDAIVKHAEESLKFMKLWTLLSSEQSIVTNFIRDVQKQGQVYCQAVSMSIKTAEGGYAFSVEAIDFCKYLLDEKASAEDLRDYIQEMRETAISARRDATESSEAFSSVRTGLFELAKPIPGEVAKLAHSAEAAERTTQRKEGFFGRLFVPKPRDLLTGVRSKERPFAAHDSEVTVTDLSGSMECLTKLTESLDAFADWWLTVDKVLSTVEESVVSMKPGPRELLRLKVDSVRTHWERLRDEYQDYRLKITRLRDFYQT